MKRKNPQKKQVADKVGRSFSLLFNRAHMYKTNHPTTVQSAGDFHRVLRAELSKVSPIAIVFHRGALYVDEEALDPKINISKIAASFKETGVESISFAAEITLDDVNLLLDILTDAKRFPNAASMKNALKNQGVTSISVNHIVYRKITEEETVVSKSDAEGTLGGTSPFQKYLIERLIESDTAGSGTGLFREVFGATEGWATDVFAGGLDRLEGELGQQLGGMDNQAVEKLLKGLHHLKRELRDRVASRQATGVEGALEHGLLDKADSVTDKVMLDLIRREYGKGSISVERLAQIIQRILPDPDELVRLLPRIERMLLQEGMPLTEFVLLSEMLQGYEAGREVMDAIAEGAESIGLQGKELLNEITDDPRGAAELIYLASEIRKARGDDGTLTEVLVEYIERIGGKMALDAIGEDGKEGDEHLQGVISRLEQDIVQNLRGRGISSEVMDSVVNRLNGRLEGCLKKLESDWELRTFPSVGGFKGDATNVLSYFEETIDSMEDLQFVLQKARESVQEMRASDVKEQQVAAPADVKEPAPEAPQSLPKGVLGKKNALYFIEKELQRAYRYKTPFTIALFEVISAKVSKPVKKGTVKAMDITTAVLASFRGIVRDTDSLGLIGNKRFVVLMPMTDDEDARTALRRLLKELQLMDVSVGDVAVDATFAGAVTSYDVEEAPDLRKYIGTAENALEEMTARLRNIQSLL
ncbi:GGDEF domain-containing protein [Desulfoluna spongiiphila]|uniref:GGDEF domain-containing protein, diguanylate cyclase (C-di-GMP synthetase) or its enzymatically inactive variants n=1 Tax=Desulfoluna spongiiphila TaxID=419481 RepID=A0A1G5D8A5_9BACT|nr:GGDEF domain-containing protein [Desulfoluna spongiiphila]SCY10915.1 GGDEF domain-containing protein, diguanylate cyclase (c-di-GMP synthetase) or its enzymatically inactive variants [Desulfoluna spongiiphila]